LKKTVFPGLVLYTLSSGLGLFLRPDLSGWHLIIWLTGYLVLSLTVSYFSFFSRERLN
jgi:ABC-type transport system involved in multi-copper enzyme maturation permease subunit